MEITAIALAITILTIVLAIALQPLADRFWTWAFYRDGELTGKWWQTALPSAHKPYERKDAFTVRQRGSRFVARGHRTEPANERDRRWVMRGYISGNEIVAVFWPDRGNSDGSSFGAILVHRSNDPSDPPWQGGYVRPSVPAATTGPAQQGLPLFPIEWVRRQD